MSKSVKLPAAVQKPRRWGTGCRSSEVGLGSKAIWGCPKCELGLEQRLVGPWRERMVSEG